jgi:hypothetical protein
VFIPGPGLEFFHPGSRIGIFPSRIQGQKVPYPDPGSVKKAADPGSESTTVNIKNFQELLNVLKFNFSFEARAPEEILRWHASETGGLRQGQETGVGVDEGTTMYEPTQWVHFYYHFCLSVQTMPRTPTPTH